MSQNNLVEYMHFSGFSASKPDVLPSAMPNFQIYVQTLFEPHGLKDQPTGFSLSMDF